MRKKRIVITGGSGLLALNWACEMRNEWDVVLGVHTHPVQLAGVTSLPLNLDVLDDLRRQLQAIAPDFIVHTAGLTSVDRCEQEPDLAQHANVVIAGNVARVAQEQGIQLAHISTDHLYGGTQSLCDESDPVNPMNVYARTKALAEILVSEICSQALIIRTNFFGWGPPHRQSFSDWILTRLREGGCLSLFDDVYFTPILADRVARFVHALADKKVSGIFNVVGDDRLSKYQFGVALAERFGLPAALVCRSRVQEARLTAVRPKDMSLDNRKTAFELGEPLGKVSVFLDILYDLELSGRPAELKEALLGAAARRSDAN